MIAAGRAGTVAVGGVALAFATEQAPLVAAIRDGGPRRDEAVLALVRGHAEIAGPFVPADLAARFAIETYEVAVAVARIEADGVVLRGCFTPGAHDEEICDRRLLARIHRLTLDRLRSEIEPVSAQDLARYLFERHHLTARSRAGGRAALRDAIAMLQGFEIAAAAWESDVLAARVAGYRAEWLDKMCLAGEVAWGRLTPKRSGTSAGSTSRATPITLALRRDLAWLLGAVRGEEEPEPPAGEAAQKGLDALRARGALFLEDLASIARAPNDEIATALWDLVGRGLVTSDGFEPLREIMSTARGARRRARAVQGRWSLIERHAPEPMAADELADRVAEQLLARYGVALRELAMRESFTVPWRDVARALRRREARGLARGGRFVAGFLGEQYALPEAVDALRRIRRTERTREIVRVRACDPLNLVGVILPGPRVPASHAAWVVYEDGAWVTTDDRPAAPQAS